MYARLLSKNSTLLVLSYIGMASLLAMAEMVYVLCGKCPEPGAFWYRNMWVWAFLAPSMLGLFFWLNVRAGESVDAAWRNAGKPIVAGLFLCVLLANISYFVLEFMIGGRDFEFVEYIFWLQKRIIWIPMYFLNFYF